MYSKRSGLVLGFHGCDEDVAKKILNKQDNLYLIHNSYDWLGLGIYFWENSPARAYEFALSLKNNLNKTKNPIITPAIIDAVIDLGNCLDLLEYGMLQVLKTGYDIIDLALKKTGKEMPQNKHGKDTDELLLRYLDCYVINMIHDMRRKNNDVPFDSVKGVFLKVMNCILVRALKKRIIYKFAFVIPIALKDTFFPEI